MGYIKTCDPVILSPDTGFSKLTLVLGRGTKGSALVS